MTKKILIVEDEPDTRAALAAWFEDEGFETTEADNGIDGLTEFERTRPDIALLDMNMPGMSGIELCREIRRFSDAPLVMFTAGADLVEVQSAIAEGATDWVLKQGGFDALIDRITEHLNVERKHLRKSDFDESIPAQILSPTESHSDGLEHTVAVDSNGELEIDYPSTDDLWSWGGEYFGFREGPELWTYQSRHVGRFRRETEIFGPDGVYMGDLIESRLVVDWHKTARRASSFTPSGNRAARQRFPDRESLDMRIGFKDFPRVCDLVQ